MKKISEYENEAALELLADILDPTVEIFSDKGLVDAIKSGASKITAITYVMRNHPTPIIKILSVLEGIPYEEYKCNAVSIPTKIIELLNDEDLIDFFKSQGLMAETPSGSAMENIKDETEK